MKCQFIFNTTRRVGGAMGKADVVDVRVKRTQESNYQFDVSVLHQDEGWDHYADK